MSRIVGKRILLVEDEFLVSATVEDMLIDLGAEVVGPAATVSKGLSLAETAQIDAAVLDVNLKGSRIDPVAAALGARGIAMVFATGYRDHGLALDATILQKPYTKTALEAALARALCV
jgi:DNA-binding response OmpR family regulator